MTNIKHNCFISFKKEDFLYKEYILKKLGKERIQGRALDRWIDSDDIDYIMQIIRNEYMANTSVTIFLIGNHSSEKEGFERTSWNCAPWNGRKNIWRPFQM